jgi:putative transposase
MRSGHIDYMKYDPAKHHRRSIRLPGYDYSQAGYYFVTICCHQKQLLFGEIVNGAMQLNRYGEVVDETYQWLSLRYPYVYLDEWIIMPNHFHGIIVLTDKPCRGVSRLRSISEGETPLPNRTFANQNANHWDN